jgi:uncharacterized protein YgfB (UPF0149 family)
MTDTTERFDVLATALADAGSPMGPAELHGGLCGMLCAGGPHAGAAWLDRCMRDCDSAATEEFRDLFVSLERDSWRALTGAEMEFAPLLPHGDAALEERVHALAAWCNGFVTGLGLGGLKLHGECARGSDEVVEIVQDFIEIGKADIDAEVETEVETAEFSFAQVIEFVRVGVQIVFEEIGPRPPGSDTIH